jgi:hypothetical protein
VADRVFFHIGLPKTGTTYLQTLLWDNRDELRRQGVLLPGESRRQHLWASGVVREDPNLDRRGPDARHAWNRLREEVNAWEGTAVLSHEFFAAASAEQASHATSQLDGAEVHVVVTARDTLALVTARWQEYVKNGSTVPIDDYPESEDTDPTNEWDWGTLDLASVLARWGASVPPQRVHVLTLPKPDEPREALWLRFAALVGIDPSSCSGAESAQNESLGVVEVELLRRVNPELGDFMSALDRGNWVRGYLAEGKLVPRGGDRFWPSERRVAELRTRGLRIAEQVVAAGYDVIGDADDLRPPAVVPERRHPDSVTDAELVPVAAAVIASMMADVRRLTRQTRALLERPPPPPPPPPPRPSLPRRAWGRLRRLAGRARRLWPGSQRTDG